MTCMGWMMYSFGEDSARVVVDILSKCQHMALSPANVAMPYLELDSVGEE